MARTYIDALLFFSTISGLIGTAVFSNVHNLAVKRGDNVKLPCSSFPHGAGGYFFWFRHGPNDSVPLCIMSVYGQYVSSVKYHNGFTQDHIKLHATNRTCEIINVDLSDSGLYFCGYMAEYSLKFDPATRVKVEQQEGQVAPTVPKEGDSEGNGPSTILLILCVLGGLNAIQLIVIFVLICRGAHTGQTSQQNSTDKQDEDPNTLNYAALSFAQNRRSPRRREELDTHVIYAATR
ncbi:hypothetical protein GJAV_G00255800 [Gymnothorax javanicus]|nr:hypothetical protein GJAV_G00255800 [Gymnothorax javanicus]